MDSDRINVNGVSLHCAILGDGAPLIFVHGSLSDFRTWDNQAEFFSKRFRTVVYSRRRHYPNECMGTELDYSIRNHAQDLTELIRRLGLGAANVAASSYGASVALDLCLTNPELIKSLVLAEPLIPALASNGGGERRLFLNAIEKCRAAFQAEDVTGAISAFVDAINGPGAYDRLPASELRNRMDNAPALRSQVMSEDGNFTVDLDRLRRTPTPMLLLSGENTRPFFRQVFDKLVEILSHAESAVIPEAAHAIHRGNPDRYNETVSMFLSRMI